jgi:hypothetical protein
MVNHRGTFGARDLAASTAELYAAFEDYAALLRVLAGEFRGLLFGDAGIDGLTAPVPLAAGSVSFATPAATVVAAPVPHAFST